MKKILLFLMLILQGFAKELPITTVLESSKSKIVLIKTIVYFENKDGDGFENKAMLGYSTGTVVGNNYILTANNYMNPSKERLVEALDEIIKKEVKINSETKDDPEGWYYLLGPAMQNQLKSGEIQAFVESYIESGDNSDMSYTALKVIDKLENKNLILLEGSDLGQTSQFFTTISKTDYSRKGKPLYVLGFKNKLLVSGDKAVDNVNLLKGVESINVGKSVVKTLTTSSEISQIETFGGPVVDKNGNLIGIYNSNVKGDKAIGYILAVDEIYDFLVKNEVELTVVVPTKIELFKAYLEDNPMVFYGVIGGIVLLIVLVILFISLSKKKKEVLPINDDSKNTRDTFKLNKKNALLSFQKGEIIKEIIIGESPITIGRDNSCTIKYSLDGSPHISSNHGRIFFDNEVLYFEDYSTNGSYIVDSIGTKNKVHKSKTTVLEGSEIYLGSSDTKFTIKNISTIGSKL